MIDAKLKGEGIDLSAEPPEERDTNVIDLMAALKKSLGQSAQGRSAQAKPAAAKKPAAKETKAKRAAQPPAKASRKRA
jgi:DNA end-binding protein Ku